MLCTKTCQYHALISGVIFRDITNHKRDWNFPLHLIQRGTGIIIRIHNRIIRDAHILCRRIGIQKLLQKFRTFIRRMVGVIDVNLSILGKNEQLTNILLGAQQRIDGILHRFHCSILLIRSLFPATCHNIIQLPVTHKEHQGFIDILKISVKILFDLSGKLFVIAICHMCKIFCRDMVNTTTHKHNHDRRQGREEYNQYQTNR